VRNRSTLAPRREVPWPLGLRAALVLASMALVALAASPPVLGDWLVLTDGSVLETKGAWTTRGSLLVFTRAKGGLTSLRADEVDLAASERLTAAGGPRKPASAAEAVEQAPPPKARFVITDADVAHVKPGAPGGGAESTGAESEEGAAAPARLIVTQWGQRDLEAGGVVVFGVLENRSRDAAAGIKLTVTARDDGGAVMMTENAILDQSTLLPGQNTRFEAAMLDLFSFSSVDFDSESVALKIEERIEGSPPPETGDEA